MLRLRVRGEQGNAVIEFITFAVVLFTPLAAFSAEVSIANYEKQVVTSASAQLARAYGQSESRFNEVSVRYQAEYPGLTISSSTSRCCVTVVASFHAAKAQAKQVL